jgi:hypothetical protein
MRSPLKLVVPHTRMLIILYDGYGRNGRQLKPPEASHSPLK